MQHDPDPDAVVADTAPTGEALTPYDRLHLITYLRLLDADASGADWREVARTILNRDPRTDAAAQECHRSHLDRARWLSRSGYRQMLSNPS